MDPRTVFAGIAALVILSIVLYLAGVFGTEEDSSPSAPVEPQQVVVPPTPPQPDPYTFHPGKDSQGGDLIHKGGASIPELEDWCNDHPNCAGFNSNGWIKGTIGPEDSWASYPPPYGGLYVKN